MELTQEDIDRVVAAALAEDVGSGDATTLALVPEDARCQAELGAAARVRRDDALGGAVAGADVLRERGADDAVDRLGGQLHRSILGS